MTSKLVIEGLGEIDLVRNPRAKNIKLKINHDGQAVISAPRYVPIFVAKRFAESKKDWIKKHQRQKSMITDGTRIGRDHVVRVTSADKFNVKSTANEIVVKLPATVSVNDPEVQKKIEAKAIESLRKQAKVMLPRIVKQYSQNGVGNYNSVTIKLVKTRWGSYSSNGNISLSLFMAQLPDELIDYIIIHELSHSVHMNHSKEFWEHVAKFAPNHKQLRKQLRTYNMSVNAR